MTGAPILTRTALIDPSKCYRYELGRAWATGPRVAWLMLNPSTADALDDDATIRKCIGFSQRWGFGSLTVVNLFAWRSTDPKGLATARDPIGPENDLHIMTAAASAAALVVAWGGEPIARRRARDVLGMLSRRPVTHLGLTAGGQPRHPLMLAYATSRTLVEADQLRVS